MTRPEDIVWEPTTKLSYPITWFTPWGIFIDRGDGTGLEEVGDEQPPSERA